MRTASYLNHFFLTQEDCCLKLLKSRTYFFGDDNGASVIITSDRYLDMDMLRIIFDVR